eukprot:138725-Prorocentrum_minimum.AAC.6
MYGRSASARVRTHATGGRGRKDYCVLKLNLTISSFIGGLLTVRLSWIAMLHIQCNLKSSYRKLADNALVKVVTPPEYQKPSQTKYKKSLSHSGPKNTRHSFRCALEHMPGYSRCRVPYPHERTACD